MIFNGRMRTFYSGVVTAKRIQRDPDRKDLLDVAAIVKPDDETIPGCRGKEIRFWISKGSNTLGSRFSAYMRDNELRIGGKSSFEVETGTEVYFLPPQNRGQVSVFPVIAAKQVRKLETTRPKQEPLQNLAKGHHWVEEPKKAQ